MKLIIMAGGEGKRWGNHLGVPKHMIKIDGEELINRILRHFHVCGLIDADIVSRGRSFGRVHPVCELLDLHGGESPFRARGDITLVVYGDVWLSDEAIKTMAEEIPDPLVWFGRKEKSALTGKSYGEIWGLSFLPGAVPLLTDAVLWLERAVRQELAKGKYYKGWEIMGVLERMYGIGRWVEIDDWTEDFDTPEDYDRWMAARAAKKE